MFSFLKKNKVVVRHRPDHCISRKLISKEALKVLYRLSDSGYKAYLVGGGVRDILLGRRPKDFDVATDANPKEIKRLFSRSFIIGRRFKLVHVVFGDTVIETATFRRQPPPGDDIPDGNLYQSDDNTFGTPEEDAQRRDFTVNGLFYDIKTFDVIDYVGGLRDLDRRVLRSIGDPNVRFREDPVRMMRAIRLACKLGLKIDCGTRKAIFRHYREIEKASPPRILEELFRMFPFSASEQSFRLLWESRLLSLLMPHLNAFIDASGGKRCKVWNCLAEFDKFVAKSGCDPSNGLRVAAIYLAPYMAALENAGGSPHRGMRIEIASSAIRTMNEKYCLPKAALLHAAHILAGLRDFESPPARGRVVRDRNGQFSDAMALARIAAAVFGKIPESSLSAWATVKVQKQERDSRGAKDQPSSERRDPPGSRPQNDRQEPANGPAAERPGESATDEAPRRRRRRPRGGRRHHRPSPTPAEQTDA